MNAVNRGNFHVFYETLKECLKECNGFHHYTNLFTLIIISSHINYIILIQIKCIEKCIRQISEIYF